MFGAQRLRLRGKPPEGGTPNQVLSGFSPEIVGRFCETPTSLSEILAEPRAEF
jgi:hypothetical protein